MRSLAIRAEKALTNELQTGIIRTNATRTSRNLLQAVIGVNSITLIVWRKLCVQLSRAPCLRR